MAAPSSSTVSSRNCDSLRTYRPTDRDFKEYIANDSPNSSFTFKEVKKGHYFFSIIVYDIRRVDPHGDDSDYKNQDLLEFVTNLFQKRMSEIEKLPDVIQNRKVDQLNTLFGEKHDIKWYKNATISNSPTPYRKEINRISMEILLRFSRAERIEKEFGAEGLALFYQSFSKTPPDYLEYATPQSKGVGGGGGGGGGSSALAKESKELDLTSIRDHMFDDLSSFDLAYQDFQRRVIKKENIPVFESRSLKSTALLIYLLPEAFTEEIPEETKALFAKQESDSEYREVFPYIRDRISCDLEASEQIPKPSRMQIYRDFLQDLFLRDSSYIEGDDSLDKKCGALNADEVLKKVKVYMKQEEKFFADIGRNITVYQGAPRVCWGIGGFRNEMHADEDKIMFAPYCRFSHQYRSWMNKNAELLKKATYLIIRGDSVEWFPKGFFKYFPNVTKIMIRCPSLKCFPSNTFQGLSNLQELILQYLLLEELPKNMFDQITTLTKLNLCYSRFKELPVGIFDQLEYLTELDLSRGELESIPAGLFNELEYLKKLDLRWNHLKGIENGAFKDLKKLEELKLAYNKDLSCDQSIGKVRAFCKISIEGTKGRGDY